MTAKEYLSQVKQARIKVNLIRRQYNAFMSDVAATPIGSVRVDGGKSASDKAEDRAIRSIELHDRLDGEEQKYFRLQDKIFTQISGLEKISHIQILILHYIEGKKLRDIAEDIGFSYQYVRLLHGIALKAFEEKYSL